MRKYRLFVPDSFRGKKLYELYPLFRALIEIPTSWGISVFKPIINLKNLLKHKEIVQTLGQDTVRKLWKSYVETKMSKRNILSFIEENFGVKRLNKILTINPNIFDGFSIEHYFVFPMEGLTIYKLFKLYNIPYLLTNEERESIDVMTDEELFIDIMSNFNEYFGKIKNLRRKLESSELRIGGAPVILDHVSFLKEINRCKRVECIVDKISREVEDFDPADPGDYVFSIVISKYDKVENVNITLKEFEESLSKKYGKYMDYARPVCCVYWWT